MTQNRDIFNDKLYFPSYLSVQDEAGDLYYIESRKKATMWNMRNEAFDLEDHSPNIELDTRIYNNEETRPVLIDEKCHFEFQQQVQMAFASYIYKHFQEEGMADKILKDTIKMWNTSKENGSRHSFERPPLIEVEDLEPWQIKDLREEHGEEELYQEYKETRECREGMELIWENEYDYHYVFEHEIIVDEDEEDDLEKQRQDFINKMKKEADVLGLDIEATEQAGW